MKFIIACAIILCISSALQAQSDRQNWCGTPNPRGGGDRTISADKPISQRLIDPNGVILIPVVFHVVYNNGAENLSQAVIQSQIQRLNTDFRKLNPDVGNVPSVWANLPADTKIEFQLACVDHYGNVLSEPGITRHSTSKSEFVNDTEVKTDFPAYPSFPTDKYLNIWTCDLSMGFLGYSTYPEWYYQGNGANMDGVVIDYTIVGDNNGHAHKNKGRVAVHEIAHWIGLYHLYGAGNCTWDDQVLDTPNQFDPSEELCPTFPFYDQCEPMGTFGIMFMNYLDNTDDPCMYMFTEGQKTRARSHFMSGAQHPIRYLSLNNFYGIAEFPAGPVCTNGTLYIPFNNPMCLPVSYTVSGPVTVVSVNDQRIILNTNTGITSGTVNLSITSDPTNNYEDDYSFDFQLYPQQVPVILNPHTNGIAHEEVFANQTYVCSVQDIPGSSFQWTIQGGTITSGQGTAAINFVPDVPGVFCPPMRGANGNNPEVNDNCEVVINVRIITNTCPAPSTAQITFLYEWSCPPIVPCCTYPGQTCCGWGPSCGGDPLTLRVYPNPARDNITIELNGEKAITRIEIVDNFGNVRRDYNYSGAVRKVNIATGKLISGVYLVKVFDGTKWLSRAVQINQ